MQLKGMLHLANLRSPVESPDRQHRHAAAQADPKVKAVMTGADLAEKGLAWMPTLSNDVQAVLATDKVRLQGQEVAFVVAEDRSSARDALELIDVEYDILKPVVDVRRALAPDAPVIRDDLDGKTGDHCFDWENGDKDATEAVFAKADVVVTEDIVYPRVHPARWRPAAASRTTSGWVASDAVDHESGTDAHGPSTPGLGAAGAEDPGSRPTSVAARQQGADLSRVRLRDRGVAGDRQARQVDGGRPRTWCHRLRPRLRYARRDRGHQGRKILAIRNHVIAEQGAFNGRGADQVPSRLLRGLHRQLRHSRRRPLDGRLASAHQQCPGMRGQIDPCSFGTPRSTDAGFILVGPPAGTSLLDDPRDGPGG